MLTRFERMREKCPDVELSTEEVLGDASLALFVSLAIVCTLHPISLIRLGLMCNNL